MVVNLLNYQRVAGSNPQSSGRPNQAGCLTHLAARPVQGAPPLVGDPFMRRLLRVPRLEREVNHHGIVAWLKSFDRDR